MQDHTTPTHTQPQHRGKKEKDKRKEEETDKQRKADEERERVDSYTLHIVLTLWPTCQTQHIRKIDDMTGVVDRLLQNV